ncbi:hypothetical protein [Paenibacillus amylolyticus]|uniref:hypothetical protein n=1 Tax=Paenibacillus amylolyticus TaxID=1451 RepID=UPI0009FA39E5|nr:hypothetical protein [Paenibacillus amylolyticus]
MFKIELDPTELQQYISKAVEDAFSKIDFALKDDSKKYPALMDKNELMDFLRVGHTKASELLNRDDFPVIREFGHPRIPLHSLMIWIDEHTEWIRDNAKDYHNRREGIA